MQQVRPQHQYSAQWLHLYADDTARMAIAQNSDAGRPEDLKAEFLKEWLEVVIPAGNC
jgi:hypothetical protein